jgi:hypothetical protein
MLTQSKHSVVLESGRIVVVPTNKSCLFSAFCAQLPLLSPWRPSLWLHQEHPPHGKRRFALARLSEADQQAPLRQKSGKLLLVSPQLYVGDAIFYYKGRSDELVRAIEAARRSGRYRTDDGQIAVCFRLPHKDARLTVVADGDLIEISPQEEPMAYQQGDTR